jgi:hypothetical protein
MIATKIAGLKLSHSVTLLASAVHTSVRNCKFQKSATESRYHLPYIATALARRDKKHKQTARLHSKGLL